MAFVSNKSKEENVFSFDSILADATRGIIDEVEEEVDILTFCEHPFYLDQPLHPQQRFILKTYYGLPLDDDEKTLHVRSFPYDATGIWLTEVGYVNFLIEQKRTNIVDPFDYNSAQELVLACGRRGGKTFLASVISAYEAYKLIIKGDPQRYYKIPTGDEIKILNVATSTDQALTLATAVQNRILNSKWFVPYIEGKNQSEIRLRTKKDLELLQHEKEVHGKILDKHASLKIIAYPCTARGVRGSNVIVAILDELAHFIDNNGNRSGDEVYKALRPSLASFMTDGKILSISSPYTKSGVFYDIFLDAKGNSEEVPNQNRRMFQIPTWEMNPTIQFDFLENERRSSPESYSCEYGAEFSSIIAGFIKYPEKLEACVNRTGPTNHPTSSWLHYIAVDPSASQNGYALAMVHVEPREYEVEDKGKLVKKTKLVVVLDRWEVWEVSDPEFKGEEYIDKEVIEDYISGLIVKFRIGKIVYDQFESTSSVIKFKRMGLNAEKTSFSRPYNMKIFSKLRNLINEGDLELFPHERGVKEVMNLEERKVGKKQFIVQAPTQGEITTDDLADVLANACYVATQFEIDNGKAAVVGTSKGNAYHSSSSMKNKNAVNSFQAYKRKINQHRYNGNMQRAAKLRLVK